MSMKARGESSTIQTFLRIRPSKAPSGYFSVDDLDRHAVVFKVPDKLKADYVNNSKLEYRFMFNGILDTSATQERVFNEVGAAAVTNALDGYNSTIFAYGQTGSGKTYTLTGGDYSYQERGIIPRAISMLFREFRARPTMQYKIYVSYLEIYNEQGYDLLDPSKETKKLEDLSKVKLLEDDHGNFHLKGLSMHPAETEEEALNLLFMGDTNRAIASTSMNEESSRSHCIFSLSIEAREAGAEKVRRSKLHLVDLAGSERVAKTNSTGSTLTEATYINKSLFFLEMVIVALYEKATRGRGHVPYRNSLMTSVLRDSLGGNCKTIMVATINPEATETDESLSTCKFAQRVARIENNATVNEEQDPAMMIKRLKSEVLNLREEVSYLKGEAGEGDLLGPVEQQELVDKVRDYCDDPSDATASLNLGALTLTKIKAAFAAFRSLYRGQQQQQQQQLTRSQKGAAARHLSGDAEEDAADGPGGPARDDLARQLRDMKALLLQRDSEINILVNMVKKGKTADDVADTLLRSQSGPAGQSGQARSGAAASNAAATGATVSSSGDVAGKAASAAATQKQPTLQQHQQQQQQQQQQRIVQRHLFNVPPPTDIAVFEDAAASFEWFRERCAANKPLAENKEELRRRMDEAKLLGERAAQTKNTISYLKSSIEALRREKALERLNAAAATATAPATGEEGKDQLETPEELSYRRAIEQEKEVYKDAIDKLKVLKPEIEMLRKLIEKSRATLDAQFNQWYDALHRRSDLLQQQQTDGNNSSVASSQATMTSTMTTSTTTTTLPVARNVPGSVGSSLSTLAEAKDSARPYASSSAAVAAKATDSKDNRDNRGRDSGRSEVDDDINAFFQAKEELLKQRGAR